MAKLRSRWAYGIFLGISRKSGEMWIAMKSGEVVKARAVERIAEEDRWSLDCVNWVRHTPWHLFKGDPEADGDIPEENAVKVSEEELVRPKETGEDLKYKRYVAPRRFHINKEDAEKHGYTRGCAGCTSWFKGLARQAHSESCRARFENLM